jgi:hypothetical protein
LQSWYRALKRAQASLLIAGACVAFSIVSASAQGTNAQSTCEDVGVAMMPSPVVPWNGAPLRVIFTVEKPIEGEFALIAPDGSVAAKSSDRQGGPPYFWYAEVASPAAGTWHARLTRDHAPTDCGTISRDIAVRADRPPPPSAVAGSLWPLHNTWNRGTENLYSAWIEKLFDAPLDAPPEWKALHEVLRDRSRNMLFNAMGLGEDEMGMIMHPDCADMPYYLRAYFAFKMGLPFGYSQCTRGGGGGAPKCFSWFNIQKLDPARSVSGKKPGLAGTFAQYIPIVGDAVHSGSGRTAANDDNTDYYPVKLSQDTLRPGTIYADPYGHVLMFTKRIAQAADSPGIFLAADAQPDGTVAIKRFWRGNFLYATNPALGGPGFKRFRPIVRDSNGALRRLSNAEIVKNPQYGDFSLEPSKLTVEGFYDRMDDVMSPTPLDPVRALRDVITSLDEQVKVRVTSVENGRKYQITGKSEAPMPDGPAIFETTGAWEDFSTPSRDLRLLIAIDVVRGFPDQVARRPERFAMPKDKSVTDVKAELQSVLATELAARKFSYPRSDGSPWTLTLKDVLDRTTALEMGYNPNDCVELRWGAPEKSEEASTCKRHAPGAQRTKMTKYREWFHDRRRPPRV